MNNANRIKIAKIIKIHDDQYIVFISKADGSYNSGFSLDERDTVKWLSSAMSESKHVVAALNVFEALETAQEFEVIL